MDGNIPDVNSVVSTINTVSSNTTLIDNIFKIGMDIVNLIFQIGNIFLQQIQLNFLNGLIILVVAYLFDKVVLNKIPFLKGILRLFISFIIILILFSYFNMGAIV